MSNGSKYLSLRIGSRLKEDFQKFCKSKGLSISKAVKIFAYYCLENGVTPYNIAKTDKSDIDDNLIRISISMDIELRKKFSDACNKYDLPMSVFLRDFMNECVVKNKFPFDKK